MNLEEVVKFERAKVQHKFGEVEWVGASLATLEDTRNFIKYWTNLGPDTHQKDLYHYHYKSGTDIEIHLERYDINDPDVERCGYYALCEGDMNALIETQMACFEDVINSAEPGSTLSIGRFYIKTGLLKQSHEGYNTVYIIVLSYKLIKKGEENAKKSSEETVRQAYR